jgi:hypothetical protein
MDGFFFLGPILLNSISAEKLSDKFLSSNFGQNSTQNNINLHILVIRTAILGFKVF